MIPLLRALAGLPALVAFAAHAAEASNVPISSSVASLAQMLAALALVLAAIFATAWLMRRLGASQLAAGGAMKVLGGVAVGPRERLVLVEVGQTWLIVGVAPGRVSAVHSMPRPEDASALEANLPATPFGERLRQLLASRRG
ncbi:flagellar biosynthetic protein FliO [Thiobacter aerophilum]|uniref:Flagellar protein n=1 Tax=Thiobacter aerophilum TaxID=3121275 RepID=A0ABV0EBH2_9BURK